MRKVLVYSLLLILGMIGSQLISLLPGAAGSPTRSVVEWLTMVGLSFIMIHVGFEFDLDKSRLREYGWDYVVAMTAAAFPWLFAQLYFMFVMLRSDLWSSPDAWKETALAARFAAPTSAGVLFSMLAAAGLSATWLFGKARILAIFDDLDTVLLMIPLQMLMVGVAWELIVLVLVMALELWIAWRYLASLRLPVSWPWVIGYAVVIASAAEGVYLVSETYGDVPIHVEVLLPAFVLGCITRLPETPTADAEGDVHHGHASFLEAPAEQRASTVISATFMALVGLSMPAILGDAQDHSPPQDSSAPGAETETAGEPVPGWGQVTLHVLALTALINLGKMFPALCYRREAGWKERLALSIGLWPRGEVGAGILILSVSYGIGGPIVTVAMLSLALNLLLTGVFIALVRTLIE